MKERIQEIGAKERSWKFVGVLTTSHSFKLVSFNMSILILADLVNSVALNFNFDFIFTTTVIKGKRMSIITAEVV